jgi:hypothetical protein
MMAPDLLDRLRRPNYTGENRCVPCTGVNVAIAVLLTVVTVIVVSTDAHYAGIAALVGSVVFVLSIGSIYLRGYLVPGTPWLTKTYFPDWLLRAFDKDVTAPAAPLADDLDLETVLQRAGAVTECEHEDDLCLTDAFQRAWREEIDRLRQTETSQADLATVLDVDPDRLRIEERGDAFLARIDGNRAGQWESQAAFIADVAGARVLDRRYDGWAALDVEFRSAICNGLRIFLERCPACDGPVATEQEVVESCCRSTEVVAMSCGTCGARLLEVEQAA